MSDAPAPTVREVFPYLIVRDAAAAIAFYGQVFGASELSRMADPSGRIGHAELQLGPAVLMLADEFPEHGMQAPRDAEPTAFLIHVHVDDTDALAERARAAGATILMPPTDQPYGERSCRLRDPFGHVWLVGQEIGQGSLVPNEPTDAGKA